MSFFLIALILGVIGAGIVFISKKIDASAKAIAFGILTVIYTLVGWWLLYAGMPTFAYPLLGWIGFLLFVWWFISCCITAVWSERWSWGNLFPIIYIVLIIIAGVSNMECTNSSAFSQLIGEIKDKNQKHWSQDIQPLDPTHIRLVPKELAISLAKTTLTQDGTTLGSQFPLDEKHITLQKINNDYYYLIPLDFKGYGVWTQADYVPGYVKVSATDPYAKPILITGLKMKYTPDAFFGNNLERMLYWKYYNKILCDYSFEEDDSNHVFWVITVCRTTIGYWGDVVDGVIVFDPQTGTDEFVSIKEIENNHKYDWIDRVIPTELIEKYINYWGGLKNGWWNSLWGKINILKGETPTINYSADGRCVIVTPITSVNHNDEAMTGLMYTDARTGQSTYYATSGGATEEAIVDAVNSKIAYKKWHASSQIVYENIYGKLSALVPILGENGNYQGLAIVENENKQVADGDNPKNALMAFQKLLMVAGGQITTENSKDFMEYTGKIQRLGWDISGSNSEKQYYLYFPDFKNSFIVNSLTQSELSLTREGDEVSIKYIVSDQAAVPVVSFRNLTLNLQSSKNEQNVQTQMTDRQDKVRDKGDIKDFKETIKQMSDEDIKEIMTKQQKK
ncbi:MAG: hypothetical protein PHR00_03715 [Patescibacteria group bacterium]|nr:hypothetical protein [Patescibacteria group bacterium]